MILELLYFVMHVSTNISVTFCVPPEIHFYQVSDHHRNKWDSFEEKKKNDRNIYKTSKIFR
jgi:hypothetical protein